MPPAPNNTNHAIAQTNAEKRAQLLRSRKNQLLRENTDVVNASRTPLIGAMSTQPVFAAAGVPAANAPAPTVAVVSKTGIAITYDDASTQQISFTQNTLSLDSGFNVYNGITYLADGLDVDGDTHLYNDLTLEGSATLNDGAVITRDVNDGPSLTVNGYSNFNIINANSNLNVNGESRMHNLLQVSGPTTLNNTLNVAGSTAITNNVTITQAAGTAFTVDGTSEFKNDVHLLTNLTIDGSLDMSSGMNITRASSAGDAITINGTSAFNDALVIERAVADGDALHVKGLSKFENAVLLESSLTVEDTTSLNNSVTITRPVADGYALTVNGKIRGMEDVVLEKNLTVNGNLVVTGSQTIVESTNTVFVDNVVTYAKNNPADLVAAGLNIEYKPSGSTDPQFAGLKRLPTSGEFVFFKNATAPIGTEPVVAPQAAIDAANQTVLDAQADYDASVIELNTANALVATRLTQKNAAEAAQMPAFDPSTIPAGEVPSVTYFGEYITFDLGQSGGMHNRMQQTGSGWTQLRKAQFLGSNNNTTWTDLGEAEQTGSGGTWNYTPSTHRYLRVIITTFSQSYDPDQNVIVFFHTHIGQAGAFSLFTSMSQVSLSPNLSQGDWWGTSGMKVNYTGGLYNRGSYGSIGTYVGGVSTSVLGSYLGTPTYLAYIALAQPLIDAYNTALTAYNAAVSDAATKAAESTYYFDAITTTQAAANAAIAAATAAAQLANASTGVYAVVVAESFNCASDARLKNNIVNLDGALDKLDNIRGVYHHWNNEAQPNRAIGVIAQEVQAVYPELVIEGGNGYLSVDYPKLTAVLLQSIKELKAMVLELAKK
jgi:hypothetical protein